MKPVAIFRHFSTEGPGYFAIFLERHGIPWTLYAIDENAPVPATAEDFAGLCFMGGPMSVNDPLPWVEQVTSLIRDADLRNIPVVGHCLGGQLMSKALGGIITRNTRKEIGWGEVYAPQQKNQAVDRWLGDFAARQIPAFHWHGETFSLPAGATWLLASAHCPHQAFVRGIHLGMQCHVEMLPEMIATWCTQWHEEISGVADDERAGIQTPEVIVAQMSEKLPAMRALADQLYGTWIEGLAR